MFSSNLRSKPAKLDTFFSVVKILLMLVTSTAVNFFMSHLLFNAESIVSFSETKCSFETLNQFDIFTLKNAITITLSSTVLFTSQALSEL